MNEARTDNTMGVSLCRFVTYDSQLIVWYDNYRFKNKLKILLVIH